MPVTFAYISDAHDNHGNSGNIHVAYGPGEAGYVQQLRDYDQAFGDFFARLASDGITKANTLFVVHRRGGRPLRRHRAGRAVRRRHHGVHIRERPRDRGQRRYQADRRDATTQITARPPRPTSASTPTWRRTCTSTATRLADSPTARDLEKAMSDMAVTNPLSGENAAPIRGDGRPGGGEAPPHGHGRPGPDTDVHAVRTRRLFPQRVLDDAVRLLNDLSNCVFLPTRPRARTRSRGTTAASSPRSGPPGSDSSGPGSRTTPVSTGAWSDHTDFRPTILSLLGLHDSYVSDGRVMTEVIDPKAVAQALKDNQGTLEALGQAWKQVNAPFGDFARDTLIASTAALASDSTGDATTPASKTRSSASARLATSSRTRSGSP